MRGILGNRIRHSDHLSELGFSFFIHAVNGRARQDIVKLVDEDLLPGGIPNLIRKIVLCQVSRRAAPQFCFTQGKFTPPVEGLGASLGGVGPSVRLEIQLTHVARIRPASSFLF